MSRTPAPRTIPTVRFVVTTAVLLLAAASGALAEQPGKDGPLTVTAANTVINGYTQVVGAPAAGASTITVANISQLAYSGRALEYNDLVLIYQAQGATITTTDTSSYGAVTSYNSAGRFEFITVMGVNGNTITLAGCGTGSRLRWSYDNNRAQAVRVPQLSSLTVNSGASLVATPWNGTTGGIVAVHVQTTATITGSIDVSGRGFRGGPENPNGTCGNQTLGGSHPWYVGSARKTNCSAVPEAGLYGAVKGESVAGSWTDYDALTGRYARGAPANGGGGGNEHNAGGGGGANGDSGATWTGRGVITYTGNNCNGNPVSSRAAWRLEPNPILPDSSGGGRGGYSYSSANEDGCGTRGPGFSQWAGDYRQQLGGLGGRPLLYSPGGDAARLFFGGGGGAGDANNAFGGTGGGAGGGLVLLLATSVSGSGAIRANGSAGGPTTPTHNDAPGGGGGGGTVVINATTSIAQVSLYAEGGTGGTQGRVTVNNYLEAEGPGGGGGGGVIATNLAYTGTRSAIGGVGGTTASDALTEFTRNGATNGATGANISGFTGFPFCTTLPVSVAYVEVVRDGRGTRFAWSTETEVGNVGFWLYAETPEGLVRLNDRLIPSQVGDSLERQDYEYESSDLDHATFFLEEVGVTGITRLHGPFVANEAQGSREDQPSIPWDQLTRERLSGRGPDQPTHPPVPAAQLLVDREGLYRVTYEALLAAGVDFASTPTASLALLVGGQPVPREVVDSSGRSVFGPGSSLVFYGQPVATLYTHTNVYTLTVKQSQARPMPVDSTAPDPLSVPPSTYTATVTVDRNRAYSYTSPTGDPWYDTRMLAYTTPVSATFPLDVDALAEKAPSTLKVGIWGSTDWPQAPDHHAIVELNGTRVADVTFDGITAPNVTATLPSGVLRQGKNELRVVLPGDTGVPYDLVMLDTITVAHERPFLAQEDRLQFAAKARVLAASGFSTADVRAYRVTSGPTSIVRLGRVDVTPEKAAYRARVAGSSRNATYLLTAAGAYLTPAITVPRQSGPLTDTRADFVIISHPDLITELAPLVQARTAEGHSVRVVDVRDLYEQYNFGVVDPVAIARFVAAAADSMATRSVLLVGADTYDYFNYLGLGSQSLIPTFYVATDPVVVRFAPSDTLFGDINGDRIPEVDIGRFPVRTQSELRALIAKTLQFSDAKSPVPELFAADKAEYRASFGSMADSWIELLDGGAVTRAYIDTLGLAQARSALLRGFAEGPALISFVGHSSATRWTFSGLFSASDAAALTNFGRPAVVSQFACWSNYFVSPTADGLAHKLLLSGEQGAAATMGPATLTELESHAEFGLYLLPKLARPGVSIGWAVTQAKQEFAAVSPQRIDIILGWTLLGDPTLIVNP